ncbi:conserved hypothetical protein [Candidatus Desulfarcum epimagneticum]|uniref:Response regulatory domain-containing protein n=1 Tax=uncultured Desulfobacteraceae bacterium TaxID=218296 RepID=A0A484HFX6_9BACT|nr:conserved hypothetical protein [uncultured Desulfobacteraceae bacterium]
MARKILVIDDDPIIVKYLLTLFEDNGYETRSAGTGLEGMEILKKETPHLITLDLQMPDEWGSRFYRKIRKDPKLKNIPIIVITGLDGRHAVKNARAVIRKPFDPKDLIRVVTEAIGPAAE